MKAAEKNKIREPEFFWGKSAAGVLLISRETKRILLLLRSKDVLEPETWGKVVVRVNGANQGALYAQESGNILGRMRITKPGGHTWESFSRLLLMSMPDKTKTHFENKIAVFIDGCFWSISKS